MNNEAYVGIILASSLVSFVLGMISSIQIMRPVHKPVQEIRPEPPPEKSVKAARQTVPLSASTVIIKHVLGQRKRERKLGLSPLWQKTGTTGVLPAIDAGPRTEEIEEVR